MLYIMHDADEDEMQPGLTCDMCGQFLVGFTLELPGKREIAVSDLLHTQLLCDQFCLECVYANKCLHQDVKNLLVSEVNQLDLQIISD